MASNGYASKSVLYKGTAQALTGVVTARPVSEPFNMSADDSIRFFARITATGVTVVGAITAKLQENWTGGTSDWEDVGSTANVTVTADGNFEIALMCDVAADAAQMPIAPLCRIVITTTNANDLITVSEVMISRRR